MKRSNFCAHILDDEPTQVGWIREMCPDADWSAVGWMYNAVRAAVKFRVPDGGQVLGLRTSDMVNFLKEYEGVLSMPYPAVAVEFRDEGGTPLTAVASQEGDIVYICAFAKLPGCVWGPAPVIGKWWIRSSEFSFSPWYGEDRIEDPLEDCDAIALAMKSIIELLAALSCRNVVPEQSSPSAIMNAARKRKGKQPFFEYKILTLVAPSSPSGSVARASSGRASPRVHLRRGHIRRLAKGNVWVNASVVGDKSKGIVHKDYAVRH